MDISTLEENKKYHTKVKKILFLSADDFKEKSIQVIRKTPEAYLKAGWEVTYIVMRDSSLKGNYYYELPINIPGVNIVRKEVPGTQLLNSLTNRLLISILIRIRRYLAIIYLIVYGVKYLKKSSYDILYGYEQPGAVSAKFISQIFNLNKTKLVLRFQGVVFVKEWLKNNLWYRKIINFDTYYALRGPSDLCIMTNDGSCGDWVLNKINSQHKKIAFWSNGVDNFIINKLREKELLSRFKSLNQFILVSISRIDDHKRVDRCIKFFDSLVTMDNSFNFHYLIVGEGAKKNECQRLVSNLKLEDKITFIGAVNQSEVPLYLSISDTFISMYESSNVGNPLLEAIRLNQFILTLNNGGTSDWIKHKTNGLIYDVDDSIDISKEEYDKMAKEYLNIISNVEQVNSIKLELLKLSKDKLWTWEERFSAEIDLVSNL